MKPYYIYKKIKVWKNATGKIKFKDMDDETLISFEMLKNIKHK